MRIATAVGLVVILALGVMVTQSLLALSVPGMSSDDAYLHLRQIESIRASGIPLTHDALSPTGNRLLVTPLYDYLLALAAVVMPAITALKIVPAIGAGLLVILVFLLAYELAQDVMSALFAALAMAFMPAFGVSLNTAMPVSWILALTSLLLWQLMSVGSRKELGIYAALIIILSFTHPAVVLVLLGLLFYAGLLVIEELKTEKGFNEVLLFSTLFIVWSLTVRFKEALLAQGPAVVFQNIPAALRATYFAQIQVIDAVGLIGVLPFLFGSYMIYTYIFRERQRNVYLLLGFALAMGLLLWMGIIQPLLGVMFLGLVLSVLFGVSVKRTADYVAHTRAAALRIPLLCLLFLLLALSSLLPAMQVAKATLASAPAQGELDQLASMKDGLPTDAVIMAMPEEGFRVEALAGRKVVQDTDFLLQKDAAQRYADIQRIFTGALKVDAVGLLNKYGATHIYISPEARARYNITRPSYADESCFPTVYDKAALVVRSVCKVEQS